MTIGETMAFIGKAAVVAGVAFQSGASSRGAFDWFIDPHHALAILFGLTGGFGFRLATVVHRDGTGSIWREVTMGGLALAANFLLAAGLTSTLISRQPPPYLAIALVAVLIGASGTTMLTLAMKQFMDRFGSKSQGDGQ